MGEKMGLGEKDGEEFDQVKVALIPVFKPHVPNEFGLGGHVVVSDHAAVPPRAELHSYTTNVPYKTRVQMYIHIQRIIQIHILQVNIINVHFSMYLKKYINVVHYT